MFSEGAPGASEKTCKTSFKNSIQNDKGSRYNKASKWLIRPNPGGGPARNENEEETQ